MEKLYRFERNGSAGYAIERAGELREITDAFGRRDAGAPIAGGLESLRLLPPVSPSKIVCVGLNYKDHAAEQNKPLPAEPLIFIKPSTSVIGPGATIELPAGAGDVHHEAEVAIVIGQRARHVSAADADRVIFGVTCMNDVTARELQNKGVGYTRAKSFDTFAPLGPCIAKGLDVDPADGIRIEGW